MKFDIECPVCFDDNYSNYSATLKCGHKLCSQCLVSHTIKSCEIKKNNIDCPLCRSTIVYVDEEIEVENDRRLEISNRYIYIIFGLVLMFVVPYLILELIKHLTNIPRK